MRRPLESLKNIFKSHRSLGGLIVLLLIICTGIYLLINIHYYYVPDPDIFEYLQEGKELFHAPWIWIPTPPFYSLLLYILDNILPVVNAGIVGGTLINIVCFLCSIYILWRLTEQWLGLYALLPILILIINPLSSLTNLQPMNAGAALFFVLLTFYLHKKRPGASYLCMALAFFCRYEAIVLLPIMLLWDFFEHKRIQNPIAFIAAAELILVWSVRGYFEDKLYTPEIVARAKELPNIEFFSNTFFSTLFNVQTPVPIYAPIIVSIWIVIGIIICYKYKVFIPLLLCLYLIGYTLIHLAFPAVTPRYSYGALPFVLILLYWPAAFLRSSNKIIVKLGACIMIILTIVLVYRSVSYRQNQTSLQWNRADKRVLGLWIQHNVHRPTIVYGFLSMIMNYYAHKTFASYPDRFDEHEFTRNVCDDTKDILIFIDNNPKKQSFYYFYGFGLDYVDTFNSSKMFPYFSLLQKVTIQGYEINIYSHRSGTKKNNAALQTICNPLPLVN